MRTLVKSWDLPLSVKRAVCIPMCECFVIHLGGDVVGYLSVHFCRLSQSKYASLQSYPPCKVPCRKERSYIP